MKTAIDRMFKNSQGRGFFILFLIIFGVTMLTSFFPLWANVPFNIIFPILVLLTKPTVMFEKLKLTTLIIMRTLIILVLFHVMPAPLFYKLVLIFLIINILEATFTDLLKNKMYFNFVTGLVLAVSVLCLGAMWIPEVTGPYSGLYLTYITEKGPLFEITNIKMLATIAWIIAYTIWNWLFVIGEFSPSISYLHIGILATPIVSSLVLWNPGIWLLARANSLTIGGVIQIANKDTLEKNLDNEKLSRFIDKVKTNNIQLILMILNLVLIAYSVIVYFS
ncbi:MAG TPA: hypothetical protein VFD28_00265 [Candidatus Eisenbacteria bacterium]|nr:hypothetical protein [Candidatus Eisenbacteria bacterium]